ncbi:hypothetical protein BpHYR1_053396 [Brachionus plicatilis]|uniref:Uncharacterized protein n=1 Tax=Brachionus plicatilis TaxID=10195 RepID=A0A3M7QXQ5_BRAPC|nr:hypothetical protein BpHYR1_053396 [Brachionus plicatilis]
MSVRFFGDRKSLNRKKYLVRYYLNKLKKLTWVIKKRHGLNGRNFRIKSFEPKNDRIDEKEIKTFKFPPFEKLTQENAFSDKLYNLLKLS